MEFHENRHQRPFIGFVLLWRAYKQWRYRAQSRRVLQGMSDAQLRDLGIKREDIG